MWNLLKLHLYQTVELDKEEFKKSMNKWWKDVAPNYCLDRELRGLLGQQAKRVHQTGRR